MTFEDWWYERCDDNPDSTYAAEEAFEAGQKSAARRCLDLILNGYSHGQIAADIANEFEIDIKLEPDFNDRWDDML